MRFVRTGRAFNREGYVMSSPRFLRLLISAALIAALSSNYGTHADYKDSFRRAMKARDRRQWDQVVPSIREAIREKPTATGEPISPYGNFYKRYLPYFYLGEALFRIGDLEQARQAFEESKRQGKALEFSEQRTKINEYLTEIVQRLFPKLVEYAQAAIDLAGQAKERLSGLTGQTHFARVLDENAKLRESRASAVETLDDLCQVPL